MIASESKVKKRIFGLDLLRVLSIALVLCSHTSWIYPPSSSLFSKAVDMCGFFGVELFFVLSGFLIGSIIYKQFIRHDYGFKTMISFMNRRLIRILPNYYLIILVNIGIGFFIGYPIADSWRYFFFFQNFASPLLPFFPESWSMPIKEFGYLIAIFLLFIASQVFTAISKKAVFVSVIVTMIIFFFSAKIYYNGMTLNNTMQQWDLSLRSVVVFRIDSVLIGVLFGFIYSEYPKHWAKYKYHLFAIGLFITAFLLLCLGFFKLKIHEFPLFWNVLCLPINSIALACFLPLFSEWKSASPVVRKPVETVSEISYSIYLIHYSIVLFLMKHYIDTSLLSLPQLHLFTVVYLAVTIFLSYLLYQHFEKPMTRLRDIKPGL